MNKQALKKMTLVGLIILAVYFPIFVNARNSSDGAFLLVGLIGFMVVPLGLILFFLGIGLLVYSKIKKK